MKSQKSVDFTAQFLSGTVEACGSNSDADNADEILSISLVEFRVLLTFTNSCNIIRIEYRIIDASKQRAY
jgi:hypothetical protein